MKTLMLLLLTASLVLITGCGDDEDFSRYPSVWIPGYINTDYIPDLSDQNPELVYNATCNLGPRAGQFSKILCAEDADPDSPEYKAAEEVYRRICSQLESKEPYTVAATLRLLQYFAKEYEQKEELIEMVSRIESDHPQVQFEQASFLTNYATEETRLPEPLIRRLIDSPSWVVSRNAYLLAGQVGQETMHQELLRRYQETVEERERLLLINALGGPLKPETARLFEEDMLASDNSKIRIMLGTVLAYSSNTSGVQEWLNAHYPQFSADEQKEMFEACDDIDQKCRFLSLGYTPDDKKLKSWINTLLKNEKTDRRDEIVSFEKAILANEELAGRWKTMKDEVLHKAEQRKALHKDMAPVVAEFIDTTKAMLAKHELSDADQEELLKQLNKNMKPLTGSK